MAAPVKQELVESGLNLLLYQFRNKENIEGLLQTYLTDLNQLDTDAFTLVDNFNIDDATGIYLDYIGRIVDLDRKGQDDETYRKNLKIKILINNSDGTPNTILKILSELTETANVRVWEHFPVSTVYYTDGNNGTLETLQGLRKSSPITTETVLIVDTTRNGFVGTELLPNYNKKPTAHFLAEFLEQFDVLIDDVADNIVDDQGDNIILFDTSGNSISYYGQLTEVISEE